jgi:hypothetical protein
MRVRGCRPAASSTRFCARLKTAGIEARANTGREPTVEPPRAASRGGETVSLEARRESSKSTPRVERGFSTRAIAAAGTQARVVSSLALRTSRSGTILGKA